jgi:7-cyano-7-deazaguanine synthase
MGMTMNEPAPAVVLLSGGMDSVTCLAEAHAAGFSIQALTFDYGQRHRIELEMARWQGCAFGVRQHMIFQLDLTRFGGSSLTSDQPVPRGLCPEGIPNTYVPARNSIFLSIGLAWAEVLGARDLFIGVNQVDYSGYPDCRRAFIDAFEEMANLATRMGVEGGDRRIRIHTPLIDLDKAQIARRGVELGVDFAHTLTCYDPSPDGLACGSCPSCLLRLKGFERAGISDPAAYRR